jgi:hypothetical protein
VTLGLLAQRGLAVTYFSQAAAIVVFEGLLTLALLVSQDGLARIVGVFAAAGGLRSPGRAGLLERPERARLGLRLRLPC